MRYVIIGNGVAGTSAAEKIRTLDSAGEITIFTDENYPFYYRPKLIYYLDGSLAPENLVIRDEGWFADRGIELHLSENVTMVDSVGKTITTGSGASYPYDRLLLAYGAEPFVLPIPGVNHPHMYTLRTIEDAQKILMKARQSKTATIIGGGLLGLETAHSLIKLGLSATIVERDSHLLARQLDRAGGEVLQRMLERLGYRFMLGAKITQIAGSKQLTLSIEDREPLVGDFALLSAGVRANVDLAKSAGITCGRGILVNDLLQTSVQDIYAAGDVAEYQGHSYGLWLPAKQQGDIAGTNMAGHESEYHGSTPSHKLKVAGIDLVSLGEVHVENGVEEILLQESDSVYRKVFHMDGVLKGAILIGEVGDQAAFQKGIAAGESVEGFRDCE